MMRRSRIRAPTWSSIAAVQSGRVAAVDPDLVNRPGPRIVESLEILAACLHPEVFGDLREKHARCVIRVDEHLGQHAM
jgi:iron complex transport system substrate-binding protein